MPDSLTLSTDLSPPRLKATFIGQSLHHVPLPAAVLDLAKIKQNCTQMLTTVHELQIGFRAHVKTHKTEELTRYQIGSDCRDVRLVVSTVLELARLRVLCEEYRRRGARTNVLYGLPVAASQVERLAVIAREVGGGGVSLMVDHAAQLACLRKIYELSGQAVGVFLKTDSGYHRAGVTPTSSAMAGLVQDVVSLEQQGVLQLLGFYSHNSLSYGGSSPEDAMDNLRAEVEACTTAALHNLPSAYLRSRTTPVTISSGASPTALSLQNLQSKEHTPFAQALRRSLAVAREANLHFEIHAGVYPVLDAQQVSACSRSSIAASLQVGEDMYDRIALSVLTEVCSLYPDRTDIPEALVSAGCLALAREPCKSYRGHGVVSPWNMHEQYNAKDEHERLIVDRVSQEHGILQRQNRDRQAPLPLEYGQRVRIWPNHACITGAQFDWYLVVDSSSDEPDIVRDMWMRWRGW